MLKVKRKSWEPFGICLLNSNPLGSPLPSIFLPYFWWSRWCIWSKSWQVWIHCILRVLKHLFGISGVKPFFCFSVEVTDKRTNVILGIHSFGPNMKGSIFIKSNHSNTYVFFLHVKRGKMLVFINGKIGLRTGSGLKTNWKWTGSGNIIFRYSIYKLLWARLLIGMQLVKITSWLKRNKNIFCLCVAMIALSSHTPPRPSEISEKKMEQKRKPLLTSHAT